jgi:site-specific recombinase
MVYNRAMSAPSSMLESALEAVPDEAALLARFGGGAVRAKDVRALHRWIARALPGADFDESAAMLATAARWLREGRTLGDEAPFAARLRLLLDVLDAVSPWKRAIAGALSTVLGEGQALPLLELGLPNDRSLWAETGDRLARRLLPAPRAAHDLGELLGALFPRERDALALGALPPELFARAAALVDGAVAARLRSQLLDAVALVAARTSALGLSREVRARSPEVALAASPFFLLPRLCDALFSGIGSVASCREQIDACNDALDVVLAHLEEFGVSVDVVYRIEVIGKNLDRLADLLAVLVGEGPAPLAGRLAAARVRDRSLRDLARTNVHLLARKIIERAGETGEHYITATRAEYWKMIASAGGGGVLTAGTCALKYFVAWGHFPLFVEGFLASTNYALSFLLMQLCGFTLATKQPSMTAAALAGTLRASHTEPRLDDLVTVIARICRSQLAAALGNIGFVIPAAIAFNWLYIQRTGHPFLDEQAAEHSLHSLHPTHTGTIGFAALTGVFLWLSSLGAGWLENWAVYRKLPEAIAQHRLGDILGRGTMRWLAARFRHGVAGVGGNTTLGFLLGMVPVFGKFLGVPLEVRHVTLSTGSLTLAACTLGPRAPGVVAAAVGIAIIGALNFGVSFALALGVALRARSVEHAGVRLAVAVLKRFARSPLEFFFATKGSSASL